MEVTPGPAEPKAIETLYKGHRFRSRLEARWAVFFDSLGVRWEYEKEGFTFNGSGAYLPDFWLPDLEYWVEIKGKTPLPIEEAKLSALAIETGFRSFLFYGDIPEAPIEETTYSAVCCYPNGAQDSQYVWCQCPHCGQLGIEFNGRSDRLPCHDIKHCPRSKHGDKGYNSNSKRLLAAYTAARSARFEHGEKGAANGLG